MKVIYQRVTSASVTVAGRVIGEIGAGVLLLVGITATDTAADAEKMAKKIAGLRMFSDADGKFNDSLLDVQGSALAVSQFTLYANTRHGRRPDFLAAARPEQAQPLFEEFVRQLRAAGIADVQTGEFGADMQVALVNDGPVTLVLDTADWA